MKTKHCSRCNKTLDASLFHRNAAHADGLQSWCRDCSQASVYKWRVDSPDIARASQRKTMRAVMARRRQAVKGAVGAWPTPGQWAEVEVAWGGKCAYCDTAGGLTIDHVIPLSAGGTLDTENTVPACRKCNSSKNAKELRSWLQDEGRYQFVCDMRSLVSAPAAS